MSSMNWDALGQGLLSLLSEGLWSGAGVWTIVAWTLITTHLTICGVTLYLHRSQAHRSVDFHPLVSHFLRFWLWLGTGMKTKDFVAVHRKHHAKCETEEDPHSPQTRGLKALLLSGVELYRAEAANPQTLDKYGRGTPDDWVERNVYSRHTFLGITLLAIVDVLLFGAIGLTVWAIQMAWIPWWATGIINGVGHYWGYRNFEAADASTNVSPWGVLIGGEELHNNHHTYPTSAKFSVKPYEFDVGWMYIRILRSLGLATPRKTPPKLALGSVRPVADAKTLEALIANRYEVMANYGRALRTTLAAEVDKLRAMGHAPNDLRLAQRWLHRDAEHIPQAVKPRLEQVVGANSTLATLIGMREELRQMWTRTNVSAEQLVADLQGWCRRAEASGIEALAQFSQRLRAAHA